MAIVVTAVVVTVLVVGKTAGVAGFCCVRGLGSDCGRASGLGLGSNPVRCIGRGHRSDRAVVAVAATMALVVPVATVTVAEPVDAGEAGFWQGNENRWTGWLPTTAQTWAANGGSSVTQTKLQLDCPSVRH